MAYEKLTDLSTDTVFALGEGPDKKRQIEGYYLGSRAVQTANGASVIHVFQTPKGNEGVWGTAKLNNNLNADIIGTMMLIVYKGKVKLQGGKTQHTYEFNIDRSQTIDVPRLTVGANQTEEPQLNEDGNEDLEEQYSADRAAKVSALLNKNRSNKQA